MSEEEKKAIELLSKKNTEYYYRYVDVRGAVSIVLNLIENQQKELNNLKEIEQSHQEENGKLRVELEQKEQIIKRLEQDVEGYSGLSKQIQEDYSKQIRDYEEGYNE